MKCVNCEKENPQDNLFCSNCGSKLSEKDVPVTGIAKKITSNITCTNCGAEYKKNTDNLFCTKCGSRLPKQDTQAIKASLPDTDTVSLIKKYIVAALVLMISLSPFYTMLNFPEIETVTSFLGMRISTDFSFIDTVEFFSDIKEICDDLYIQIDSSDETFIKEYLAVCAASYAAGLILACVNIFTLISGKHLASEIRSWRINRIICFFDFIGNALICGMINSAREYVTDYIGQYAMIRSNVPTSGKPFFYLIQAAAVILILTSFIAGGRIKRRQKLIS